jgi:hypothetical protein
VTGLLDGLLVIGFLEGLLDFIVYPEIYNKLQMTGFKVWFTKIRSTRRMGFTLSWFECQVGRISIWRDRT